MRSPLKLIRVVSYKRQKFRMMFFIFLSVKKKKVDEENLKQFSRLHEIAVRKNDLMHTKKTYLQKRPGTRSRNTEMVKAATENTTEQSVT